MFVLGDAITAWARGKAACDRRQHRCLTSRYRERVLLFAAKWLSYLTLSFSHAILRAAMSLPAMLRQLDRRMATFRLGATAPQVILPDMPGIVRTPHGVAMSIDEPRSHPTWRQRHLGAILFLTVPYRHRLRRSGAAYCGFTVGRRCGLCSLLATAPAAGSSARQCSAVWLGSGGLCH